MARTKINLDCQKTAKQQGFTIIELLISTAVFSVVLMLCATAIVQVGRMFYKGVTINRTQDTARQVTDDVIQAIQFGNKATSLNFMNTGGTAGSTESLCLGQVRYTFINNVSRGTKPGQSLHLLWKDYISSTGVCTPVDLTLATPQVLSQPGTNGIELLGENMRIPLLSVTDTGNGLWSVSITVSYGEDASLFVSTPPLYTTCVSKNSGGQFCASSSVSNIFVAKRL